MTGPWPALESVFHGNGFAIAKQRLRAGAVVRDEYGERRGHRDVRVDDLLHGRGVVAQVFDVRRVHERGGRRLDCRERVVHAHRVHDGRQVVLLALGHDELERVDLGTVARRVQHHLQVVVAGLGGGFDGLDRRVVRYRWSRLCGHRPARGIGARGILARSAAAAAGRTRDRHEHAGIQPGPAHLALVDSIASLEELRRIDRGQHGREARVEELLQLLWRACGQPLRTVALNEVAMRVDQPRHDGLAARVDRARAAGGRRARGDARRSCRRARRRCRAR